ncbi:hypothetical protein [Hymenobacter sp. PAMC 26628]|uniref:hypothetical protein n=1 Tax=Hymenobacter sp. PAMC 26628 TaxID=1484118 RepID=UPI00077020AA|nr:hypothetical protein [Hymenobacter sp. PAMC 26628]AMJ67683.1 hypothetical protein AXW84_21385 [Hymenobacter sp. PAMC 26628]
MKTLLLASALLLTLAACRKDSPDPVQPEYADWYALRAPDDRAVEAVAGDLDGTLVITTGYAVYQTTDRGKTWKKGDYKNNLKVVGFAQRQDSLISLSAETLGAPDGAAYAVGPNYFSLDQGLTWRPYHDWRRSGSDLRVARNRAAALSGTEYSVDLLLTPTSPSSSSNYVETVGVKSSAGRQLRLPKDHQITSLYFDAKSRLYVAASAALCGRRENFAFCGEQNGVLYVSKAPQP